jgi:Protein of unknown function (DUF3000)
VARHPFVRRLIADDHRARRAPEQESRRTLPSMAARGEPAALPEDFRRAVETLRPDRVRPEVVIDTTPAPQRLAPYAHALTADVVDESGTVLATGRLVLLHDPAGHDGWRGTYRLVSYVRAELEPEIAADPLLPEVGWTWLAEALAGREADHTAASGTVTRVASQSFGEMADRPPSAEIEVRASWTPVQRPSATLDLSPHLAGWIDLLCTTAGLPPLPTGVVAMPSRRRPRSRGEQHHR